MRKYLLMALVAISITGFATDPYQPDSQLPTIIPAMNLVWNDEFNTVGKPNPAYWVYENGFVRNEELQWYQSDNANCANGTLILEAKRERKVNPNYVAGSTDWKKSRQYAEYTSACIKSPGLVKYQFGRIEVRARINTSKGSWPAIWTLGESGEWPSNGEVDILEFYRVSDVPTILANVAWGTSTRWSAKWDSAKKPLSYFTGKDANWVAKFHTWRMDWNKDSINLYLDNELLNFTLLNQTINAAGVSPQNPFLQKHYFLLNLAIGAAGGDPSQTVFPIKYEVDYIRVYQPTTTSDIITTKVKATDFIVSPNPAKNVISLTINSLTMPTIVSIFNLSGMKLKEWTIYDKQSKLNVSDLTSGIYCLNINSPNGNQNHKIQIQ